MTALTTNYTRTGSPGGKKAEAWGGLALAAVLAGAALVRFPGRAKEAAPAAGVTVEAPGRRFSLPEERSGLIARWREQGAFCGRAGRERPGPEGGPVCLSNSERWVWGLPLDLNRATRAELGRVPGLGGRRADQILRELKRGGRFQTLAECFSRLEVPVPARLALEKWFMVEGISESDAGSARQDQ